MQQQSVIVIIYFDATEMWKQLRVPIDFTNLFKVDGETR